MTPNHLCTMGPHRNQKARPRHWIAQLNSDPSTGVPWVMLMIGIDFALFWAVLTFLLNFIPFIGSIVAVSFPILLTLVQPGIEDPLTTFLVALLALAGAQQLVGSFIEPRMMGRTLNLSPLVILISLATWWSIWGVIGMLISIPIMVILVIVFSQFEATRPVAVLMSQDGRIAPIRHIED